MAQQKHTAHLFNNNKANYLVVLQLQCKHHPQQLGLSPNLNFHSLNNRWDIFHESQLISTYHLHRHKLKKTQTNNKKERGSRFVLKVIIISWLA